MKKYISLLLALVLCLSLCACGGDNGGTTDTPKTTEAPTEVAQNTTYKVGEAFGTDNVECVITGLKWLTSEEFKKFSTYEAGGTYTLNTDIVFPDYHAWGSNGATESKLEEITFLCVTHSLQNVGKENVEAGMEANNFGGYFVVPYGTMEVIYDDGYTFNWGDDDFGKYCGFTSTLSVMGSPVNEVMIIGLPNQVFENDDKPMQLKVTLPASNGETQEFIVDVDSIEKTDLQELSYKEAVLLMNMGKYGDATKILLDIQGYKDADTLLLECCIKGWEGFDYLKEHKDDFTVVSDEELKAELISTSWQKSDGEIWKFYEDGTVDTGRTKPADGSKVIWDWSVQGDTLWLGTVDQTLTMREVYDGAFVGFTGEGKVYISMWKAE